LTSSNRPLPDPQLCLQRALQMDLVLGGVPVIVVLLLVAFGIIYYWVPKAEHPQWHWFTPGAIVALALWFIASFGLRYYLESFNTYSRTYGALTAVNCDTTLVLCHRCGDFDRGRSKFRSRTSKQGRSGLCMVWQQDGGIAGTRWWLSSETLPRPAGSLLKIHKSGTC